MLKGKLRIKASDLIKRGSTVCRFWFGRVYEVAGRICSVFAGPLLLVESAVSQRPFGNGGMHLRAQEFRRGVRSIEHS